MADFDYIKRTYGLDFHKGQPVYALGKLGVVTGTQSAHVMVKVDGLKHANPYHPSDVKAIPSVAPTEPAGA